MIGGLYSAGDSPVHRMRAGLKLVALALFSTGLFLAGGWAIALAGLVLVLGLFVLAGLGPAAIWRQFRVLVPVLLLIGATHALLGDWHAAIAPLIRLTAVVLGASLLTVTTRSLDLVEAIEHGLRPVSGLVPPDKVALAIALSLRFIPVLAGIKDEIREAQRARGLEGSLLALAVPLIVRSLKMTDDIAEAIDARR